jgi:hypothetical protein
MLFQSRLLANAVSLAPRFPNDDVERWINFHHVIQQKRRMFYFYSYTLDGGQKRPKHVV